MPFIKPHQLQGVRFMWRTIQAPESDELRGCILAHSMGLGKTFQTFLFCRLLWVYAKRPRILILAPKVTLVNWAAEFRMWGEERVNLGNPIPVYQADGSSREERPLLIQRWFANSGVLLMGYEMYTRLASSKDSEVPMHTWLVDPGPDVVVLDEGHRVKSKKAAITRALSEVRTRKRIGLTGYPLQNCLMEYWCMVDWIRPGYWPEEDFRREYKDVIEAGHAGDATPAQVEEMRHRLYMLTEDLKGFVQRMDQSLLEAELPPKTEFVVTVRLTKLQRELYRLYRQRVQELGERSSILAVTNMIQRICNHPDIVKRYFERREKEPKEPRRRQRDEDEDEDEDEEDKDLGDRDSGEVNFDWAAPIFSDDYQKNVVANGSKMGVLFGLIEAAARSPVPEKTLVFSQFTETLDVIEALLQSRQVPGRSHGWRRNEDYFRLDGQCSAPRRQDMINLFNAKSNSRTLVFLISTRAGGIGVNLVGASRVVVFDVCWNPCHDNQAIFRAYRYGQTRPVKIYRLVAKGTTEDKIYRRQLQKIWLFSRVVDDKAPMMRLDPDTHSVLDLEDSDGEAPDVAATDADPAVLGRVVASDVGSLVSHVAARDQLLKENVAERLTAAQKRQAEDRLGHLRDLRGNRTADTAQTFAARCQRGLLGLRREQEASKRRIKACKDSVYQAYRDLIGDTADLDLVLRALDEAPVDGDAVPSVEDFERRITGRPTRAARPPPTTLASRLQQLEELGGAETGFDVDDGDLDAILNA
eukprot:EG_transcript_2584